MKTRSIMLAAATALWAAAANAATVVATPQEITFTSYDQHIPITVTANGKPATIKGLQFLVDDHNYMEMLSVKKEPGKVILTPTKNMEIGSYVLVINTTAGAARVNVNTPLNDLPTSLENQEKTQGITHEQLMLQKGLAHPFGPTQVDLKIPAYTVGQTMTLDMPLAAGHTAKWTVNGKVVSDGAATPFTYTFSAPGKYTFEYTETAVGHVVAQGSGTTEVTAKKE